MYMYMNLQVVNENNKPVAGLFNWTALNRKDKLKVLKLLHDRMDAVCADEDACQIGKLWKVCMYLHVQIILCTYKCVKKLRSRV